MKHSLTFLILLCMSILADENAIAVKVTTAGTLKAEVEKQAGDYLTITELTISGPLNSNDILTLRQMTGRGYYDTNKTNGQLSVLDLTNALIVEGGEVYTGTNKTKNNLFPQYAFSNCPKLTSIVLPNSIYSIEPNAFYYCEALTSVIIPNSVTAIGKYAFCGCKSLVTFTIPNSVISMGKNAFSECTGLTSITLSNSLTSIEEYVFSNCTGLASLTIPNSMTSIGFRAFESDINLFSKFSF